jgi:hypothetical protein
MNRKNRFEPAIAFIKEAKDGAFLLTQNNLEKKRDFLQKVGSNLKVMDKQLVVEFKNPWKIVVQFNSECGASLAADGKTATVLKWRKGWDSCPKSPFSESSLTGFSCYSSLFPHYFSVAGRFRLLTVLLTLSLTVGLSIRGIVGGKIAAIRLARIPVA